MASKFLQIILIFFPLLLVHSLALAQSGELELGYESYDRRIITKEQIEERGVARLRDILEFLDFWPGYSTDRLNWYASPNNLAPYHTQNWQVMIDGQVMDMQILGKPNFSTLPIRIEEIDYIEIIQTPQQHHSVFTDRGLIHIHTALPKEGFSVNIRTMLGQEVNEPGPYEYTELRTKNEEASGPDTEAGLYWRHGNWAVTGGYTFNVDKNTDGPINLRFQGIRDYSEGEIANARVYKHSGNLRAVYQTEESRHHISASVTRAEDYFFNRAFAQEIPVFTHHRHLGFSGNMNLSDTGNMEYSTRISNRGLDSRPNVKEVDFDLFLNTAASSLIYHFPIGEMDTRIGISLESEKAKTHYNLSGNTRNNGRFFVTLNYLWSDRLEQETDLGISSDFNKLATQNALRFKYKAGRQTSLHSSVTYSGRLPREFHSLWYWADQGYPVFNEFEISVLQQSELKTQKQATLDFAVNQQVGENLNFIINPFFRSLSGFPISLQEFTLDESDFFIETTEVNLFNDETVLITGINSSFNWKITDNLGLTAGYSFQTPVNLSDEISSLWDMHPQHQASANFTWKPVSGFMIWSRFGFTSKTIWHEYEPLDGEDFRKSFISIDDSFGTYHNTVPSKYRLDVSVRKSFLNGRLYGTLRFRNILNQRYRYHPVGSDYDMMMYAILNLTI